MTPTSSAIVPFVAGSLTVLRVGDATSSGPLTDKNWRPVYLDEYTSIDGGALALRQTIPLPSTATNLGPNSTLSCLLSPNLPYTTGLSTSGDGLSIVFPCFNTTVGGVSNTLNAALSSTSVMRLIAQAGVDGTVSYSAIGLTSGYYLTGQVAAVTSSVLFAGVAGGSATGNGARYVVPGSSSALGATTIGGATPNIATNGASGTAAWRYSSSVNPSFISAYGTYGGNLYMFSTIDPYVSPPFTGFIISKGYATASWRYYLDVQNTAQVTYTNTTQLANPRGFVVANYSAIWACDLNTGVYLFGNFSSNGQTLYGLPQWLTLGGPYTIPGESQYNSVALSTDGIILYVVALKGVYGLYTASGLWVSNSTGGSLLVAAQTGSALRGIALSPNYPQ